MKSMKAAIAQLKRTGSRIRSRSRMRIHGRIGSIPEPDAWVFIAACPDSGTTLLKELLATHPAIGTMPAEGQLLTDELITPRSIGMPRLYALLPELFRMTDDDGGDIDVERIKRQWGHRFNDSSRPVLLDDSPPNAARARWLQRHFSPASFIFLVRNGFAVSEGIRRNTGCPLDMAAEQWRRSNGFMLEDLPYLDRVYRLRYEDLSDRPAETLSGLLSFLGVDPNGLDGIERTWTIHGRTSPITNMNGESLTRLTREDRTTIERIASPLLSEFGYLSGRR
jgi:hypothetical protein